jgi:hypothetical protein
MNGNLQIDFKSTDVIPSVRTLIERRFAKLETISRGHKVCRVVIDMPHARRYPEGLFIRIELESFGHKILVLRGSSSTSACENIFAMIRGAFIEVEHKLAKAVLVLGSEQIALPFRGCEFSAL